MSLLVDCTKILSTAASDLQAACVQAEAARRAAKVAARAATNAAWIQVIPVLLAGLTAFFTLSNWRREAHGRRKLELAEECYVSGSNVIFRIRAIRAPFMSVAELNGEEGPNAELAAFGRRVDAAEQAFSAFLPNFQRAKLYCGLSDKITVSLRLHIVELWHKAEQMIIARRDPRPIAEPAHQSAMKEFYGRWNGAEEDPIEDSLKAISIALDETLLPIFAKQQGRKVKKAEA